MYYSKEELEKLNGRNIPEKVITEELELPKEVVVQQFEFQKGVDVYLNSHYIGGDRFGKIIFDVSEIGAVFIVIAEYREDGSFLTSTFFMDEKDIHDTVLFINTIQKFINKK